MFQAPHAFNELRSLDYSTMKIEVLNFLPIKFNSDVLFVLPPIRKPMGLSKQMHNMDKKYKGCV
jgi:hypothetical protein